MRVAVRGQLLGVSSVLLPRGFQRWNLGHQPPWLGHLTDPSLDFWDKVLLCSPPWPGTHYAGLTLRAILLSQLLKRWDFRHVSSPSSTVCKGNPLSGAQGPSFTHPTPRQSQVSCCSAHCGPLFSATPSFLSTVFSKACGFLHSIAQERLSPCAQPTDDIRSLLAGLPAHLVSLQSVLSTAQVI